MSTVDEHRLEVHVQRTQPDTKVYHPIVSRDELKKHLQWALCVELGTIPPYLCALYSIVDLSTEAANLVRSVVVEEMLHMALISNLMNSLGAKPSLDPHFVPRYPGFIPHHAAGGPFIQLAPLTTNVVRSVFMTIEQPEPSPDSPAEGDEFHTIGQFYKAIEEGFRICAERYPDLFDHDTGFQRKDTFFGGGGGDLLTVHDLPSALLALEEISEQGEGTTSPQPPIPGDERFGDLDHWGARLDGTFGPIVGTPWELSHYRKFQQIADHEVPFPDVHPMQPNPSPEALHGVTRGLSDLFDGCYTLILRALHRSMTSSETESQFFGVAFPLMRSVLPLLATLLMRTPLQPEADPSVGPTAGPAFLYRAESTQELVLSARDLLAHPPDLGTDYGHTWVAALESTLHALRGSPHLPALSVGKPIHEARGW
jgi:Ferritin-like